MKNYTINNGYTRLTNRRKQDNNSATQKLHLVSLLLVIDYKGESILLPYCRTMTKTSLIDGIRHIINDINTTMLKYEEFEMPSYFIPKHERLMNNIDDYIDINIDLYFKSCGERLPYSLLDYKVMTTERYSTNDIIMSLLTNIQLEHVESYLYTDVREDISAVDKNIITYMIKCTAMSIIFNGNALSIKQLQTLYHTLTTIFIDSCSTILNETNHKQCYRKLAINIKYITLKSIVAYSNLLYKNTIVTEEQILNNSLDEEYKIDICELIFS